MSGISGPGGAMSVDRIMAMRSQILERNAALSRANAGVDAPAPATTGGAASFGDVLEGALKNVNSAQAQASDLSASYERGETIDIAKVMLARQQASVGFEATLQVRNKLLSAYKDIMSMPV
ncbi:flagellar hook-basal body complex protein FliE [Sphingomonas japonica]|uniref:Flagellar hook-basal body complex protein FliE n=1 Tax=Sphingomonas japonica TaxID=511662 RepID=A0ABX0TZT7_9SPHN|nr:flagellar hook-basal body complex protein FliE [Sphingomonas japonica]NIJ23834.1 flagellar hook-basal body complex protein FliE [Sphingomonas japonica]